MRVLDDNGDRLLERDGIVVARIPAIVEQKWPGIAARLCEGFTTPGEVRLPTTVAEAARGYTSHTQPQGV